MKYRGTIFAYVTYRSAVVTRGDLLTSIRFIDIPSRAKEEKKNHLLEIFTSVSKKIKPGRGERNKIQKKIVAPVLRERLIYDLRVIVGNRPPCCIVLKVTEKEAFLFLRTRVVCQFLLGLNSVT